MSTEKDFLVYMTCKVRKLVTCTAETAEEVKNNPWDYAVDEIELEQVDWQVDRVEAA